jgi:hypothetical protein
MKPVSMNAPFVSAIVSKIQTRFRRGPFPLFAGDCAPFVMHLAPIVRRSPGALFDRGTEARQNGHRGARAAASRGRRDEEIGEARQHWRLRGRIA